MLLVTCEISGTLVTKNQQISIFLKKNAKLNLVAPKYVYMKMDININVWTFTSSFECTA